MATLSPKNSRNTSGDLWPLAPEDIFCFGNAGEHTADAERNIAGHIIKRNTADLGKERSVKWIETHPNVCFSLFTPKALKEIIAVWEKPRSGRTEKALARKLAEQAEVLTEYRNKLRLSEEYHAETARLRCASGVENSKQRIKTAEAAVAKAYSDVSYEPAYTVNGLFLKAEALQVQDDGLAVYLRDKGGAIGGMARFIDATVAVVGMTPGFILTREAAIPNDTHPASGKSIESLFNRWCEAERLASLPITDEEAAPYLIEYQALQEQITGSAPETARELAIILLVGTDRWASCVEPKLRRLVEALSREPAP